jgi:enamine deaminase RidA (YjgF/YER057c/UK114 family)
MIDPKVEYINPANMITSKAFSQMVSVTGPHKTIYIGGQNAVDKDGNLIGSGDLGLQTKQVLINIGNALAAVNATYKDIVKWNIYMVAGSDPGVGYKAFQETVGQLENPPVITVLEVAGLGNPNYLVEIEAIAIKPVN